jgi:hypothetical protein
MKGLLPFLIFSFMLEPLCAQYVKPYHREDEKSAKRNSEKKNRKFLEASKRKLLVVLNEEDPKKIKEFQKSEEKLSGYRNLIKLSNQLMTDLVPRYWRQENCQVEFKKYSECMSIKESGSKDYFTIDFSSLRKAENMSAMVAFSDPKLARKNSLNKTPDFGKFEISLIEKFGKDAFYEFATISPYPNELDFTISIQQMNNLFLAKYSDPDLSNVNYEALMIEKHPYLNIRTLLIDSSQIVFSPGFKNEKLNENYPYAYKFCGADEILKAINLKDTAYAYLAIVPVLNLSGRDNSFNSTSGGGMEEGMKDYISSYTHYLIDAASSEALFFAKNQPRIVEKTSWQLDVMHILKLYNLKIAN